MKQVNFYHLKFMLVLLNKNISVLKRNVRKKMIFKYSTRDKN